MPDAELKLVAPRDSAVKWRGRRLQVEQQRRESAEPDEHTSAIQTRRAWRMQKRSTRSSCCFALRGWDGELTFSLALCMLPWLLSVPLDWPNGPAAPNPPKSQHQHQSGGRNQQAKQGKTSKTRSPRWLHCSCVAATTKEETDVLGRLLALTSTYQSPLKLES